MEETWKQLEPSANLFLLVAKLKKTKVALRSWNKLVFGGVDQTIKTLEEKLEFLEHRSVAS